MTAREAVALVLQVLEGLQVPYVLVGSLSSNHWGVQRSTMDADFNVILEQHSIEQIAERLAPAIRMDPQVHFEAITGKTRYIAHVAAGNFRIDFFELHHDPHIREEFARRQRLNTSLGPTWLPTPEDVIIEKARWSKQGARVKDIDDFRNVIAVQGVGNLDWDYIYRWADEHGTRKLIERVRASVPDI